MPGENLHKLSVEELEELRKIVRRVYFADQGMTEEQMAEHVDDREVDKLIDSLLPETVEKCREIGIARGFISKKKFFLPTGIVGINGKMIHREKTSDD